MAHHRGIKEKIDRMLDNLTKLTKEEADAICDILDWDDEDKLAFRFAKKIFDENEKDD